MNADDFQDSAAGHLEPTTEGPLAFVPNPLPTTIELGGGLGLLLDEASRSVAYLAGIGETLISPQLLIRPFLRREAVLSSRIEGTQASLGDLYMFEASGERRERGDAREVSNYVRAVERGQELLETLPICSRLANEMHAVLLADVRGNEKRPGQWRDSQVWIGPEGTPIEDARFVPSPPAMLPQLMADWERFVNDAGNLPPLVAGALMHYQFEAIHPYADGNGRIGRALFTLFLIERNVLRVPLLYMSAYLERNRQAYYDHLYQVSATGKWAPWLEFFLTGVAEQAKDATDRSSAIRDLHERYRKLLLEQRAPGNALRLLDDLFASPYMTVAAAQRQLGLSNAGARRLLERMAGMGIVEAMRDTWPRYYVMRELLTVID